MEKRTRTSVSLGVCIFALLFSGAAGAIEVQAQLAVDDRSVTEARLSPDPANSTEFAVTENSAHSRTWARVTRTTNAATREVIATTNAAYVELATGLNRKNAGGAWVPSDERIEVLAQGGAVARGGQHQLFLPGDIYSGAIVVATPDGKLLTHRPAGLSYFDGTRSVLLAELKPSTGKLLPSGNQVIYEDILTDDIQADLLVTYRRSGVECDLVLRRNDLPDPAAFGLEPGLTRVQWLTEFFDTEDPVVARTVIRSDNGLTDSTLQFGENMRMDRGSAFLIGDGEGAGSGPGVRGGIPVSKSWRKLMDRDSGVERTMLIEELPLQRVAEQLEGLPLPEPLDSGANAGGSPVRQASVERSLPRMRPVAAASGELQLAVADAGVRRGMVLDYVLLASEEMRTLEADTTYYVTGPVFIDSLTVEGGTVVKYAKNAGAKLTAGWIDCQTDMYRPAIFTARDHDIGETISGSSGVPSGYYADIALEILTGEEDAHVLLDGLRIAYANVAICRAGESGSWFPTTVRNVQILHCGDGIVFDCNTGWLDLGNALLSDIAGVAFNGYFWEGRIVNATVDRCGTLADEWGYGEYTASFTNCVLANITNFTGYSMQVVGDWNIFHNTPSDEFSGGGPWAQTWPFESSGAADYYLAAGWRDYGTTTAIDPALLGDLRKRTTVSPVVLSNVTMTADVTLGPRLIWDSGVLDAGYHYAPLDYVTCRYVVPAGLTLTIMEGTAIGHYTSVGIWPQGGSVVAEGSALSPIWFVRHPSVQEQQRNPGVAGPVAAIIPWQSSGQNLRIRFSRFVSLAASHAGLSLNFADAQVRDSEFWGAQVLTTTPTVFNNNLMYRTRLEAGPVCPPLSMTNNLFIDTVLYLQPASAELVQAHNNLFDRCTFWWGALYPVTASHNAYCNCMYRLYPTDPDDKLLYYVAYKRGPLGDFYQPDNSVLINAGSCSPGAAGLHHHTVTTNLVNGRQVKDGASAVVDIGLHYVAVDAAGLPIDGEGDGLADAIEDTNGNGVYNAGTDLADVTAQDTDNDGLRDGWEWAYFGGFDQGADDDYDGDGYTNGQEQEAESDPNSIRFELSFGDTITTESTVEGTITVLGGEPVEIGVLRDSTDFERATWTPYGGGNVVVNLGPAEGWHEVWVGLRGREVGVEQTWEWARFKVDRTPPELMIEELPSMTVSQPLIQLRGLCPESLSSLSCTMSNAAGAEIPLMALVLDRQYDTNTWDYVTNTFQLFDIDLEPGLNELTIQATDLAGNSSTTTLTLSLVPDTEAPALALTWPLQGRKVGGQTVTLRGVVDDVSTTVTASVTDGADVEHTVRAVVDREGRFWAEQVPLEPGVNTVTLSATDSWNNVTTTQVEVEKAAVTVTMNPVPSGDLWKMKTTVSGTVSDPDYTVWVNGVPATMNGGNWTASDVPMNQSAGMANFNMTAYPPGEDPNDEGGEGGEGGDGGEGSDNPPSPNSADENAGLELTDRIYVEEDIQHLAYEVQSSSAWWETRYYAHTWRDEEECGGHWELGMPADEFTCTMDWPASRWPDPEDGTATYTGSPWYLFPEEPVIGPEHCDVHERRVIPYTDAPGWEVQTYTRKADTKVKLFTGGRAVPRRRSLFVLSAFASLVTDLRGRPPYEVEVPGGGVAYPYGCNPVPSEQVSLGALGSLGSDGRRYAALPNGTNVDVTPIVMEERFYWFGVPQYTKHVPQIWFKGSVLLDPQNVVPDAETCVGQNTTFAMDFSPALSFDNGLFRWKLPPDFVNKREGIPPQTSYRYSIDYDQLRSQSVGPCWYVNGTGGNATVVGNLQFANGQYVSVPAMGKFSVYRPGYGGFIPVINNMYMSLGTLHAEMMWTVRVDSRYGGWIGVTQLMNGRNPYFETYGDFWLDGNTEIYGEPDGTNPLPYDPSAPPSEHFTVLSDSPQAPFFPLIPFITMDIKFEDYLRFKPVGENSIFVTLATNSWFADGEAWMGVGITRARIDPATNPVDCDKFPYWLHYRPGE